MELRKKRYELEDFKSLTVNQVNILKEKHPDGIPYSVANYGDVPFGKKMSATIVIGTYL